MIFLIHIQEKEKLLAKTGGLLKILRDKRPDAEIFEMRSEEWSGDDLSSAANRFSSFVAGQGLFEKKLIIVLKNLCMESLDAREYIIERLEDLQKSDNVFIFAEGKLDAKTLASLKKFSQKVIEEDTGKVTSSRSGPANFGGERDFNVFALGDAFGERNKGKAWSVYEKALMKGSEPEELHGLLFWQLKSMLLAANANSAEEAGLKPFVFSKSKRFSKNYSEDELRNLSGKMVRLYHESRLESRELSIALERFILEI